MPSDRGCPSSSVAPSSTLSPMSTSAPISFLLWPFPACPTAPLVLSGPCQHTGFFPLLGQHRGTEAHAGMFRNWGRKWDRPGADLLSHEGSDPAIWHHWMGLNQSQPHVLSCNPTIMRKAHFWSMWNCSLKLVIWGRGTKSLKQP